MTVFLLAAAMFLSQSVAQPDTTATLRGRVVDKETSRPLRGALVSLRSVRGGWAHETLADDRGEFEFIAIAAGEYELSARAGEYSATHIRTSYRSSNGARSNGLLLMAGDIITGAEIALPRAMAISGRVVDDAGNPLANVALDLLPSGIDGTLFAPARRLTTDDRGIFRIFGVPPGRVVLCADPQTGPAFSGNSARRTEFVRTCYPQAAGPDEAQEVIVTNQDVAGVEIRLRKVATYTISGSVLRAPGGIAENVRVSLTRVDRQVMSATGTLLADGAFVVTQVPPGTYELSAGAGDLPGRVQQPGAQREWGGTVLEVTTADVEGVILPMTMGATLRGRVTFEEAPAEGTFRPIEVRAVPVGFQTGMLPTGIPATTGEDGTFVLSGLFGPLAIRAHTPRDHFVKKTMYRGRDITDVATTFDGDAAHEVEIVLTASTSEVSGRVLDDKGELARDAWVLYFPADARRWNAFAGGLRQRVTSGRYRVTELIADEYFVAAIRGQPGRFSSKDYQELSKLAERVMLAERERKTVDLRVVDFRATSR